MAGVLVVTDIVFESASACVDEAQSEVLIAQMHCLPTPELKCYCCAGDLVSEHQGIWRSIVKGGMLKVITGKHATLPSRLLRREVNKGKHASCDFVKKVNFNITEILTPAYQ
ncbi:hypothetical protein EV702DRAFT_1051452 [Suillus placidus]|uniref:Uncharacterized protein n=1 Tax=Suillus placidus TaxID=48579 RepID=A0A9P7CVJ4_9AGAM|nr:hypothetical protein EV702DRAFT_1051452 [Suillus placidus]